MVQTLICQHGSHPWNREATRGRKPKFCPDHQPTSAVSAAEPTADNTETLTCAHGNHTWQRVRTRGRKPPFCPEHRPQVTTSTGEQTTVAIPSVTIRPSAVSTILAGPQSELRRKLEYTVKELENPRPWREQGDWMLLIDTHRRLTQQAERAIKTEPEYIS